MTDTKFHIDFTDKRVLVTGGTRGIGRATVEAFLGAGARVAVNGASDASVARALNELAAGERAIAAPGDVAVVADCARIVEAAVEGLGGLDVLVNSAGVFTKTSMAETNENLWDSLIDINVKGTYFCSRAALDALDESGGSIVNVASEAGLNGYAGATAYCASKGAIVNLTRSMALELAPTVRVNCICPGVIDTDMARIGFADLSEEAEFYPLKRIGTATEVAKGIVYLASPDAGFITGSALAMDGGATAGH
jgi:NAD(P)-dependent dehydrogenase (short-subunit alcohol dehydrogenase family)